MLLTCVRGAWLGVPWLVGSVLRGSGCAVRPGGSGGCPQGYPPFRPVTCSCVLWGSLSLGCAGFRGVGWCGPLGCVGSSPVLSLCLLVVPRPSCCGRVLFQLWRPCRCVCVVALAVAAVIAWRLGCGGGLCCVLGGSLCGCLPLPLRRCTLLTLCRDWWSVGATRCGSCPVRYGLRRRVWAGVRLWGDPGALVWLCSFGVARCRRGGGPGGRCPSLRCGVPVIRGARSDARRCALSPSAMAPGLSFFSCWHGERETRCRSWGEGDTDRGRRWRAWWC